MTPLNRFLEPVTFMIIIADDEMKLAVQVEHPAPGITRILE